MDFDLNDFAAVVVELRGCESPDLERRGLPCWSRLTGGDRLAGVELAEAILSPETAPGAAR